MAIFKPTDCSPFNGTFDISENSADLPIIFECKVDTSNTIVTGYSIEIYDSNNELIFPSNPGPVASNVTYLSELKQYVLNNFSSLIPDMRNINSGLNGTYLEIPFYVETIDATPDSTVARNQMSTGLTEGQTYAWKITLYQEVRSDDSFPPAADKYYDMTVTSGTVNGSNEKRIQTALIDNDDRVVNNLALVDKFIQPILIQGLDGYNPAYVNSDPVTSWYGTIPTTFSMTRSLIAGYDSTYGYIYPSTAADNAFAEGQITQKNANGFQVFKNGNNPSNLGATDMVNFIYEYSENDGFEKTGGSMKWVTTPADETQSYWKQTYITTNDPDGVFYPFTKINTALSGGERIIFNGIQKDKVEGDKMYYGSPYNGIFSPSFSSTEQDSGGYEVTVIWNRATDASSWGALSNKIIYNQQDGKNYEINTTTQVGSTNKTPFKFVEEKPIRIFNTAEVDEEEKSVSKTDGHYMVQTNKSISSVVSIIRNDNNVDITKDCVYSLGRDEQIIIYTPTTTAPDKLDFTIKYVPYSYRDYAGIIFYNELTSYVDTSEVLYIRPSININKNMIFKKVTTTTNPPWANIEFFNKDYNYIVYTKKKGVDFNPIIDKTRYQIKSFYKDSDYNPFSIYKNPIIVSTISDTMIESDGFENNITTRNFTVVSTYDQDNYIQWKSYQWFLYDSAKRTILKKTDEQYDGEITATFYGLDPQKHYILSLVLQTNSGKIIEIDYVIYTNFTESAEQKDLVEVEFDCDTLAVKADLKLVNTVLAPDADEYLSESANPTKDTAYYYDNENSLYKKKNSSGNYETVASVNESGILKIQGQNSLSFSKSYSNYKVSDTNINFGEIQTDADEIVLEGAFTFSDDYNGNIFSISRDDNSTATVEISIPQALTKKDSDGSVDISSDIDKIKIKNGSYLKIIGSTDKISNTWQNSDKFYNTSVWKRADQIPSGNRINVANFKYAEVKNDDGSYNKSAYRNINGAYNSYNDTEPLKNPIDPKQQGVLFLPSDGVSNWDCTDTFYVNQPDKLIWLDYTPTGSQKSVVIDADESEVVVQKMTVTDNTLLYWPSEDAEGETKWKDGIYVESGREKTLIGQILINDEVVKSEYLDTVTPIGYSDSGLTQQIQVSQNINERKEVANYEFAFRIFVNTNNFSVDQIRSRCYASPKLPTKGSIITIDENPYRVLKINNSVAEVLPMYEYQSISYDDLGDSNIYANSISDTICNVQFYNSLSSQIKDAIVQKAFFQDAWVSETNAETGALAAYVSTWRNPITLVDSKETQSLMNKEYGNLINKYCYLISLQDVIDYLGTTTAMDATNTTFSAENINSEFFGSFIPHDTATHKILLNSAYSGNTFQYLALSPSTGRVNATSSGGKTYYIRPAFQIDLNKIKWER